MYQETLNWMFAKLPMYQKKGKTAFRKKLTNILAFVKELENPQKKIKTIHIGGTNGKGSTSHMVASILQEAGYKVGLYTSPHLKSFTERIRINGIEIPEEKVVQFIQQHKIFLEKQQLSFFEMTVGLAFDFFAKQKVDIAIIEVGLGGRLDSTNIITSEVSVITNIGLDHMEFLGETLPEIALEKAGIIKKNIPVVIGEKQEEVETVFIQKATEMETTILFASDINKHYTTDLLGNYQKNNTKTAVVTVQQLKHFKISEKNIKDGLLKVVRNTNLKGRWQVLQENPKIICDTAHNRESLYSVLNQLKKEKYKQLHIVLGFVSDKSFTKLLPMFPKHANYYFCKPNITRGLSETILKNEATMYNLKGEKYKSVKQAFDKAKTVAKKDDIIYIGGSTFVVAEII